jgi:hypothetical protein
LFLFSRSAISLTVKNSLPFINIKYIFGLFRELLTAGDNLLNKRKVKKAKYLNIFHQRGDLILINITSGDIIYR